MDNATVVRWKLNAITLVNNNSSGNQSKRGFDRVYGGQHTERGKELWTYTKQNFAKIAEDIGALGIRVEKPAEIGAALQQALKADRPVVIEVVSKSNALAPVAVSE
jgi:acetolactate synthase-1/2/3 large subunit